MVTWFSSDFERTLSILKDNQSTNVECVMPVVPPQAASVESGQRAISGPSWLIL